EDLPDKHVDTGAGFERLVAYLENKTSVYDTDLFYPVIKRIEVLTGIPYKDAEDGMPHRVLADHIRTVTFAIADNVLPSNEGRGYVLRRLIRRALRYAQKLGMHEPVLYKLVKTVISIMSDYLEYLPERQEFIENLVKAEEESFLRTLDAGLIIFEQIVSNIKQQNNDEISGKEAFKLYDTYGFPLDLTEVMAREQFLTVDVEGFNSQLEKQKERSRQGRKKEEYTGARAPAGGEARLVSNENDRLGMARHHTATHLLHSALREVLGKHVSQSGSLVDIDRLRFDFLHYRALTKENLREVGDLINRKISDHLKVDIFPMSLKEAKEMGALSFFGEKYDEIVNVVKTGSFSMELCGGTHVNNTADIEKIKIISETAIAAGTRRIEAVCGKENIEKYEQKKKTELIIKIKGRLKHIESGIQQIKEYEPYIYEVDYSALEDRALADLEELENRSLQDGKLLDKRLAKIKNKQAGKYMKDLLNEIRSVNNRGFGIFCKMMDNYDMPMLRTLSDNIVQARDNVVIILAASKGDKGLFLVRIPGNKINLNAVDIINELTSLAGGGGGGRPDMAQAGGANPDKIPGALSKVEEFIIENS
ncbi:MAG: hypothetical protein GY730_05235, partial [bacterium]|nr:hypothetical protein [bacterium]